MGSFGLPVQHWQGNHILNGKKPPWVGRTVGVKRGGEGCILGGCTCHNGAPTTPGLPFLNNRCNHTPLRPSPEKGGPSPGSPGQMLGFSGDGEMKYTIWQSGNFPHWRNSPTNGHWGGGDGCSLHNGLDID